MPQPEADWASSAYYKAYMRKVFDTFIDWILFWKGKKSECERKHRNETSIHVQISKPERYVLVL